jgi:hypothetical protein
VFELLLNVFVLRRENKIFNKPNKSLLNIASLMRPNVWQEKKHVALEAHIVWS